MKLVGRFITLHPTGCVLKDGDWGSTCERSSYESVGISGSGGVGSTGASDVPHHEGVTTSATQYTTRIDHGMLGRYGPNQLVPPDDDPPEPASPVDPGLPGRIHESLTSTPLLLMTPVAAEALWLVNES
jgi:hypothetical protein